jgi:tRNA threonylcarbamoyladenosine biosynthesis protein TsaB
MIVLALDTTTVPGSAALWRDGVVSIQEGDPSRPASRRLPGDLLALLAEPGLAATDVDVFAVASGPGSLTGLRVGIATVQGLAFATGKPVVGVPALEALAVQAWQRGAAPAGTLVGACMNAFRGEVYWAAYRVTAAAGDAGAPALREEDAPDVLRPEALLARLAARDEPLLLNGDGAAVLSAAAASSRQAAQFSWLPAEPLAGVVAELAAARAGRGEAISPHAVRPIYIRRPDAEVARERRAREAASAAERPAPPSSS